MTIEKRLQLDAYSSALRAYLARVLEATGLPDDDFIRRLQTELG